MEIQLTQGKAALVDAEDYRALRAAVEYYGEFARLNCPAPRVEEFKST